MPTAAFDIKVSTVGLKEVVRALDHLPRDAQREAQDGAVKLARDLATTIRAAGRAESRQAAAASRTVRATRGRSPEVIAGPHKLLYGSEFGATRRFGWYRRARYRSSPARQFKPHRGAASYWFFKTHEAESPRINAAARDMADAVIRKWSA